MSGLAHTLDLEGRIATDFPFLQGTIFLDSAATSQMPTPVFQAMAEHYLQGASSVHRGVYDWSERATSRYEEARKKVARFIGADSERECLFVGGTTDGLNLIASSWGEANIKAGDRLVVTQLEHHSNLLPWHQLAERRGAELHWWRVDENGALDLEQLPELLALEPKLLALTWVSNVTGAITPLSDIVEPFRQVGATVVLDGAQGVPHLPCRVRELGVDLLVFSGHKMLGPTGVGVVWGREAILESMPPWRFGGSMILSVREDRVRWADLPHKFEGGTPNISGVHGLGAAIDYLEELGMQTVRAHELELTEYALEQLGQFESLQIFGPATAEARSGVISFDFRGIHPHDLATILGREGVCIRAGHHCCQPLMRRWGRQGTTRASFYVYNTRADVDALILALQKAAQIFRGVC